MDSNDKLEYINWFHNLYKNKGCVYITNVSQLDEEDKENSKKLKEFYDSISELASIDNIKPFQCKNDYGLNEKIYNIKLNNFICSIGVIYDNDENNFYSKVFMSIIRFNEDENTIDFDKIKKKSM